MVCGVCSRKFVIVDPTRYGCSGWRYRGQSVCNNTVMASRQLVESMLLAAIVGVAGLQQTAERGGRLVYEQGVGVIGSSLR